MSVSFCLARNLRASQVANDGDERYVPSFEVADITVSDNEDYSKELEKMRKRVYTVNKEVDLHYSQNNEEDSQTVEENKKIIIKQLMFIINKYQTHKDVEDLNSNDEISDVGESMLKNESEQLSKDIPQAKSNISENLHLMVGDNIYRPKINEILNDLPRIEKTTLQSNDVKVSETTQPQSNEENKWPRNKTVKSDENSTDIKDTPPQTIVSNNDLFNEEERSKGNENEIKESYNKEGDTVSGYEISDGNESRNEVSIDGITNDVPDDKHNTFKDTSKYKSAKTTGHNDKYQIKGVTFQGTDGNINDGNEAVSSNTETSEIRTEGKEGEPCLKCREDANQDKDDSQPINEKSQFTGNKIQGKDKTDVGSRKILLSSNNMNNGQRNHKYQVNKGKFQGKSNMQSYRENKDKVIYHDINYKKPGMNNVLQSNTRYWMI